MSTSCVHVLANCAVQLFFGGECLWSHWVPVRMYVLVHEWFQYKLDVCKFGKPLTHFGQLRMHNFTHKYIQLHVHSFGISYVTMEL